jgi:zinc protease
LHRTAAALALSLALAAPAAGQEIPDIPFAWFALGNGLTVIVHEDHKAPIVAVNVWYHVGSRNERPGRTGFAHLFEHLMFNGSEHAPGDWNKVLDRLGATDVNGTTNEDRTNYFQTVPASALDTVLWMESDRMGHLLGAVTQAKLDEQRGVVQNEKRQNENQPYGRVDELTSASVYPKGHPYSWPVIGSMEDLQAASLDDVHQWFKTWYGPGNAVLVVAGDVTVAEARAKVEKYFGDIPPGPPLERQEKWVARRTGEQRAVMEDRVPQARLYLVWNTAEWGAPDDGLLDLAAGVLTGGKSSRLYKRLVYDERIATDVSAYQGSSELGSNFSITATARPGGDLAAVEKAIREELARFLDKGPTADELSRVRTQRLAGLVRAVEKVGGYSAGGFFGKADILARSLVFGGRPDFWRTQAEQVKRATPAEVLGAARRWLGDGVFALEVRPAGKPAAAATGADRSKVPEPGPAPAPSFPEARRLTLSNGLRVVVAERHAVPVVQLQLLVDAGYASDQFATPGTARLAGEVLDEGTKTRTSLQIDDELDRLGASLGARSNLDLTTVSLSALKANLDRSLALFADVVLNPAFPQADFDRMKQQLLAAIGREGADPFATGMRVLPGLLYGKGHAYANPLTGSGTSAAVESIGRDDVERWWSTWFRPNNATLVVVGDTSAGEILPKLEKLFGGWKPAPVPQKNLGPVSRPEGRRLFLVDRPGSIQSLVLVAQVIGPRANPQEIAQTTMNTVLGGQFTSRVNMNLREEKHWSYGAATSLLDARGPRLFWGYAPVQADKTKESLAELQKEIRGIRGERPVTAEELAMAQSRRSLALPGRWEGASAIAASLAEIVRFGFPDDYFKDYAGRVRAVTLDDVTQAARAIDPDRLTWVVVGDRKKVEAGLKELGLGDPVLIDADGSPAR